MPQGTQQGFLVLADISGYTSYVHATELEHADSILSDLLDVITSGLIPPLALAKLEGDAVFAYVADDQLPRRETLLDAIDRTYLNFRDRVEGMRRGTTCECNACRAIPTLDLKFIVHHGEYLIQHLAAGQELLGSDVNLVHRLSKNHVTEATGWRAYVLLTGAGKEHASLECEELHQQTETYEHLGDLTTYSYDLHARYTAITESRHVLITREEADTVVEQEIDAPPSVVWDWLNDPQRAVQWMGVDEMRPILRPGGRTGVGARNHCMHGKSTVQMTVLDWKPFDYYTIESAGPMTTINTFHLTPTETGTHFEFRAKAQSRLPGMMSRPLCKAAYKVFKMNLKVGEMARLASEECRELTAIA